MTFPIILMAVALVVFIAGVRILPEYERGVVFRLGRYTGIKSAGLKWIIARSTAPLDANLLSDSPPCATCKADRSTTSAACSNEVQCKSNPTSSLT